MQTINFNDSPYINFFFSLLLVFKKIAGFKESIKFWSNPRDIEAKVKARKEIYFSRYIPACALFHYCFVGGDAMNETPWIIKRIYFYRTNLRKCRKIECSLDLSLMRLYSALVVLDKKPLLYRITSKYHWRNEWKLDGEKVNFEGLSLDCCLGLYNASRCVSRLLRTNSRKSWERKHKRTWLMR